MPKKSRYNGRSHTLRFQSEAEKERYQGLAEASPEKSLNRYALGALKMRAEKERR
jgi:hypothetical protein